MGEIITDLSYNSRITHIIKTINISQPTCIANRVATTTISMAAATTIIIIREVGVASSAITKILTTDSNNKTSK